MFSPFLFFLHLLCLVGIIFFCLRRHSGTGRIIYNSIIKKDKEWEREKERKRDMGKRKIQHFHIGSLMKSRNIYIRMIDARNQIFLPIMFLHQCTFFSFFFFFISSAFNRNRRKGIGGKQERERRDWISCTTLFFVS